MIGDLFKSKYKFANFLEINKLLIPDEYVLREDKKLNCKRDSYTELNRELTIYLYDKLTAKYHYLPIERRYYTLLPVLAHVSGEWATYIINLFFRLRNSEELRKLFEKNEVELKEAFSFYLDNIEGIYTFNDLTRNLINNSYLKIIIGFSILYPEITADIINGKDSLDIKNITKTNNKKINLNQILKEAKNKSKNIIRYILSQIREFLFPDRIAGLTISSTIRLYLNIIIKNINFKKISINSEKYVNNFIRNELDSNKNELNKIFNKNLLFTIAELAYINLPIEFFPVNLSKLNKGIKLPFRKRLIFCSCYQREINTIKKLYLTRLNRGIIIGSQHGASYGYEKNMCKTVFSEFLLDGYISSGYDESIIKWTKPYLGFFPAGFKFNQVVRERKLSDKKIGSNSSLLYIETQYKINKLILSDRSDRDASYSKYRTFILINNFIRELNNQTTLKFDRIYIKPWMYKQSLSQSDFCIKNLSKPYMILEGKAKASEIINDFKGLVILDDISTPLFEILALGKPFLAIIDQLNDHTEYAERLFDILVKEKFITFSVETALESIYTYLNDPREYTERQYRFTKEMRQIFCLGEQWNISTFTKEFYRRTIKE